MSRLPFDLIESVEVDALRSENQALRVENQILKDEIARLKGLPPRPPSKPRQSSGMESATDLSRSKRRKGRCITRGAKRDSDRVTRGTGPPPLVWRGEIRISGCRAHSDRLHAGASLGRGSVAQGRVQALPIVKHLD